MQRKASGKASPFAFRRELRASFRLFALRLFGKRSGELTEAEMALVLEDTFSVMEKLRPELDEFTRKRVFRRIFPEECQHVGTLTALSENVSLVLGQDREDL